jgi:hypothetical protein
MVKLGGRDVKNFKKLHSQIILPGFDASIELKANLVEQRRKKQASLLLSEASYVFEIQGYETSIGV